MPLEHILVLAILQGVTEFLPISSSGHLLLLPAVTGWQDQGLSMDVMAHVGSLMAIMVYFWRDILQLLGGAGDLIRARLTDRARLALYIALATIPAVILALILEKSGFLNLVRNNLDLKLQIVGWGAIVFGLLMYAGDRFGPRLLSMADMKLTPALAIGMAQALALIPGTSRSGITITAARFLGFERPEAARFSFLLGIPAIAGAGVLKGKKLIESGAGLSGDVYLAIGFTFLASLVAIAFLMALIRRRSLLPFVLYRLGLGIILLGWAYVM